MQARVVGGHERAERGDVPLGRQATLEAVVVEPHRGERGEARAKA